MGNKFNFLSVLLAVMLVGSNMVLSGHVSSHTVKDSGFCSICIHPGSPDGAITTETGLFFTVPATFTNNRDNTPARYFTATLYDHQSRAPPKVT
jgi:hypothetical protein